MDWRSFPPISGASHQTFTVFGSNEHYYVGGAVRDILASPESFRFGFIARDVVAGFVAEYVGLDVAYAAGLSEKDAARPLLSTTSADGTHYIIDGYHRAARALQLGASALATWVLTVEQTDHYRIDAETAAAWGITLQMEGAIPTAIMPVSRRALRSSAAKLDGSARVFPKKRSCGVRAEVRAEEKHEQKPSARTLRTKEKRL